MRPDPLATGSRKRRRVDGDYKVAVAMDAVRDKKAATAGAYVTATSECSRPTANSWTPIIAGQYRVATMMSFQDTAIATIAFDASRVGQPKEDTVTYAFGDCCRFVGGWLPVQARCCEAYPRTEALVPSRAFLQTAFAETCLGARAPPARVPPAPSARPFGSSAGPRASQTRAPVSRCAGRFGTSAYHVVRRRTMWYVAFRFGTSKNPV